MATNLGYLPSEQHGPCPGCNGVWYHKVNCKVGGDTRIVYRSQWEPITKVNLTESGMEKQLLILDRMYTALMATDKLPQVLTISNYVKDMVKLCEGQIDPKGTLEGAWSTVLDAARYVEGKVLSRMEEISEYRKKGGTAPARLPVYRAVDPELCKKPERKTAPAPTPDDDTDPGVSSPAETYDTTKTGTKARSTGRDTMPPKPRSYKTVATGA